MIDISFADQYYHIYNARLNSVRQTLIESSLFRWGQDVKNVPLEQLNASLGDTEVFVIGTLFKIMPKQPSILRELEDNEVVPNDPNINFTSEEDSLVLHETDENVQVVGDIDPHAHVTGIPVSLLGHQLNGGSKFHVTDICYAGLNLSVYKSPSSNGCSRFKEFVGQRLLVVSGLEFGFDTHIGPEKTKRVVEALRKLRDLVDNKNSCGDANGYGEGKVSRIIIAGNSTAETSTSNIHDLTTSQDSKARSDSIQLLDKYLFTLAQSGASIDLMPGKNDPTSFLLPQQPFHPKILPKSGILENVKPRGNPCRINIGDLNILATSGENIEAIRKHTRIEFSTTILKNSLEWGHIAPCAPDNLSCVPFKGRDPFIIDFVPDIYLAGNQPEFAVTTYRTDQKQKIQLISVPRFIESLSCVSINLSNLEVDLINFD